MYAGHFTAEGKRCWLILLLAFFPLGGALAQGLQLKGKITGEAGEGLPGAIVLVKGTQNGTTADASGSYSLSVPDGTGTLLISFVGYTTREEAINNRSTIDVVLQANGKNLEEVVVVGYGTQKKVNLTGAVSALTIDDQIFSRAVPNVSAILSGLVPGLAATQSTGMAGRNTASLLIRGLGTVNSSSPLVVVDGMPGVDINRLDLNDVESISVLKDAASAAVYGSRAANGVILITTKTGKGKKVAINYTTTNALETPTKAYDFMADYPRALTLHQRAAALNTLPVNQNFKNGTIDQWLALALIDPVRYPNTDWWDIILRKGFLQRHHLSASGGNEQSNFYISASLQDQQGLQINNDYRLYNARINYDYQVRRNIKVGVKLNGNASNLVYALEDGFTENEDLNTAGLDMQHAIAGILPYDPATGYYGGVMAYGESSQAYNPYTVYVNSLTRQNSQDGNGSMYLDWTPVKGLTARLDYALRYYHQFRWNADIPNQAYNFQTQSFGSRVFVGPNAGVSNATNTGHKNMLTGRLNYHIRIGENHELSALAIYSEEYWFDRYQASFRNDRLHPSLHEIDAALTAIQTASGNTSTEGLRSYIGRVNYTAFDKYLLEANFRYDGSSKFLPGHQYGFFPSVAVGWRFLEEDFISSLAGRLLSHGKLRLSYGSLGNNSGVSRYEQQHTLQAQHYILGTGTKDDPLKIVKGLVNNKIINPKLSWETTTVFNAGLDLGFLDNRLLAELDYYDRLTSGMVRPSELSILLTGAYVAPRRNIGNLRNRGLEGSLSWTDKFGQVRYGINLNASYNANTLEKWNEFLGRSFVFLNMPHHFLYTYESLGIAQTWEDVYQATPQGAAPGDILRKDLNGDGRIDGNDRKAYPKVQRDRPSTHFALNTHVSWKGFDLAVLFQGTAGRKDYWLNNYNNVNFGSQRYASSWQHWENPWSLENRAGAWPRLAGISGNREETTFWLDNMSYLRLKNLQLGYRLPASLVGKVGATALRIFGSAENLATFTSYRGLDPEKGSNRNDLYPLVKSYSLGMNLSF